MYPVRKMCKRIHLPVVIRLAVTNLWHSERGSCFLLFIILLLFLYKIYFLLFMCLKFLPENFNLDFYPLHFTNIYTCRVTTTSRVCGGLDHCFLKCYVKIIYVILYM